MRVDENPGKEPKAKRKKDAPKSQLINILKKGGPKKRWFQ
jgi:hypothetical protein